MSKRVSLQDLDVLTDADLLRSSQGEAEAFGVFYDRHVEAILAYCQRRTGSAQTAADLTAETFAQAFISRRRFRDTGRSARPWLFVIARAQINRWLRKGRIEGRAYRRIGLAPMGLDDDSLQRVEALVDFQPLQEEIRSALDALSPAVARAVVLRIGFELPYDEVARRLGCTEGAARVRVSRGLVALADLLEVPG